MSLLVAAITMASDLDGAIDAFVTEKRKALLDDIDDKESDLLFAEKDDPYAGVPF